MKMMDGERKGSKRKKGIREEEKRERGGGEGREAEREREILLMP